MNSEGELAAAVVVYILGMKKKRKKGKKPSTWVKPWLMRRCSWVLQHPYVRIEDRRCGGIYKIS